MNKGLVKFRALKVFPAPPSRAADPLEAVRALKLKQLNDQQLIEYSEYESKVRAGVLLQRPINCRRMR